MGTDMNAPLAPDERRAWEESATVLPFDRATAEQTVRTQQVQVVSLKPDRSAADDRGRWLVLAPVTERGEAIGVLELTVPAPPEATSLAKIQSAADRVLEIGLFLQVLRCDADMHRSGH